MARIIELNGVTIECRVDDTMLPSVLRAFAGRTQLDAEVDLLPNPSGSGPRALAVRLLRWYRARVGPRLGHRCVLDPSCSRFTELAVRQAGIVRGSWRALQRLVRCKPGHVGVDLADAQPVEEPCATSSNR